MATQRAAGGRLGDRPWVWVTDAIAIPIAANRLLTYPVARIGIVRGGIVRLFVVGILGVGQTVPTHAATRPLSIEPSSDLP